MIRKIIFKLILLLLATQVHALHSLEGALIDKDDSFGFTIEPSFGYLLGQVREIVYDTGSESTQGESSSKGYYLSELIWDLTDILYSGITVSANINNRFYINGGLWTAVNPGTGFMNDYDWVYYNSTDARPYFLHDRNDKTDLSHWSLSTVEINESFLADINITYDFITRRLWNFSVIGGYKYIYWSWTDIIIDSMYDGIDDYLPTGVNGIDYQLSLNIPYVGIGGAWYPESGFVLQGRFLYSPFVIGLDHDHHKLRTENGNIDGLHFYDRIYFGQFISATIKVGYVFSDFFSLFAQSDGDYLFETKGNTAVYSTPGGVETFSNIYYGGAGIQYQSLSFSLNAAFSF